MSSSYPGAYAIKGIAMNVPPQAFREFRKYVDRLLGRRLNSSAIKDLRSHLRVLPPSVRHLANQAENSKAFHTFAMALLPSKASPSHAVSGLLRRSGFYHGILARRSTTKLWSTIRPYVAQRTVQLREFLLLDGCQFPLRRFSILEWIIERFSQNEIRLFGPPPQVCESFYPRESLDEYWLSMQWFLYRWRTRDERPGAHIIFRDHDLIEDHWKPLLTLSLYDATPFAIPIVVESERGWKLRHIRSGSPMIDTLNDEYGTEVPVSFYIISEKEMSHFKSFIR